MTTHCEGPRETVLPLATLGGGEPEARRGSASEARGRRGPRDFRNAGQEKAAGPATMASPSEDAVGRGSQRRSGLGCGTCAVTWPIIRRAPLLPAATSPRHLSPHLRRLIGSPADSQVGAGFINHVNDLMALSLGEACECLMT